MCMRKIFGHTVCFKKFDLNYIQLLLGFFYNLSITSELSENRNSNKMAELLLKYKNNFSILKPIFIILLEYQ